MIAVDTSAIVAILEGEEDAEFFKIALENDEYPIISAATFVELGCIMKHRAGGRAIELIDQIFQLLGISVEPLTEEQALIARKAYYEYGTLNFGDTYSYALAKAKKVPLLFKGNDFSKTDIQSC